MARRRPSGSRCLGHRLPGPRRSAPSRPAGEVRERPGNSCRAAAWGCAVRPYPHGSPSHGRGSHCAGCAAPHCVRRARHRTALHSPNPPRIGRQSRSSRAGMWHRTPFSRSARRAIFSSVIVVILGSELRVATQPYSGSPRWLLTGPPAPDPWRSLGRAGQRPPTPSPGTRPTVARGQAKDAARQACSCCVKLERQNSSAAPNSDPRKCVWVARR